MFRILVVDDNPIDADLLREVAQMLSLPTEIEWAGNGAEALERLSGRTGTPAALPHLILIDVNMPRVNGLETLAAIKSDPKLSLIPVIMLSTTSQPDDVRKSYQAHANCFVQKPTSLTESEDLLRAIQNFWMNFAILPLPPRGEVSNRQETNVGLTVAPETLEASNRAPMMDQPVGLEAAAFRANSGCAEHARLLGDLAGASKELVQFHEQQFVAIVQGDRECHRFDLLIHMANEKKQHAKYAYLRHVEEHGCLNWDVVDKSRT